jgi:hypothetical protein
MSDGQEVGPTTEGAFGEVLQHGYTHRQNRPDVLSLFTGRSDELVRLPGDDET